MHYYKFNIKDWTRDTAHLSVVEEGVYRRLLDYYYETEKPIPQETQSLIRRLRLAGHEEALGVILSEFFSLESDGYHHGRCDSEISAYHAKAQTNRANGKRGGRPSEPKENPVGFQKEPTDNLNHKPLTTNQEPVTKKEDQEPLPSSPAKTARKTKIPDPFMLTADMRQWAAETAPAVDVRSETENFVDYWRGEAKTKADWPATWRNWMRRAQKDAGSRRGQPGGFVNRQQQIEDENMRVVAEIAARSRGQQDDFIGTGEVIIEGEVIHAQ